MKLCLLQALHIPSSLFSQIWIGFLSCKSCGINCQNCFQSNSVVILLHNRFILSIFPAVSHPSPLSHLVLAVSDLPSHGMRVVLPWLHVRNTVFVSWPIADWSLVLIKSCPGTVMWSHDCRLLVQKGKIILRLCGNKLTILRHWHR